MNSVPQFFSYIIHSGRQLLNSGPLAQTKKKGILLWNIRLSCMSKRIKNQEQEE